MRLGHHETRFRHIARRRSIAEKPRLAALADRQRKNRVGKDRGDERRHHRDRQDRSLMVPQSAHGLLNKKTELPWFGSSAISRWFGSPAIS